MFTDVIFDIIDENNFYGTKQPSEPTDRIRHLVEELLAAGTLLLLLLELLLPRRLAKPGPARAPRPPQDKRNTHERPSLVVMLVRTWLRRDIPMPPSPVGPMSCMSWLWLMLPNRLCRPPSPLENNNIQHENESQGPEIFRVCEFLLPPRADRSCPPLPPPPRAPGMGGLLRYSFTLRQFSSSLSVLGS